MTWEGVTPAAMWPGAGSISGHGQGAVRFGGRHDLAGPGGGHTGLQPGGDLVDEAVDDGFGHAVRQRPEGRKAAFDRFVVAKFVAGIIALLHEVARNPQHELRRRFDQATERFIERLATEPDYRAPADAFKQALLEHLEREQYYQVVWDDLRNRTSAHGVDGPATPAPPLGIEPVARVDEPRVRIPGTTAAMSSHGDHRLPTAVQLRWVRLTWVREKARGMNEGSSGSNWRSIQ